MTGSCSLRYHIKPNLNLKFTRGHFADNHFKFFLNGQLTNTTTRIYKQQNDSVFSFVDYEDNSVTQKGFALNLLPLVYHGKIDDYYKNGNKRFEAIYEYNRLISNLRWKENGEKDIDNVFNLEQVEIEPKYTKGSLAEYIRKELKYPEEALRKRIEGRVILQLIIMEDGSVDGIKVLKSVDPLLDAEAIKVAKLTSKKWTSGKIGNVPVRVAFNVPINFKLY
ncbi:energy transducer TonB [Bacteroidales bacterium OttesenSCG-928-I21]|nr:energy transducer TonB [Bacteroidales bacterium OttesenSCG-928-I21]